MNKLFNSYFNEVLLPIISLGVVGFWLIKCNQEARRKEETEGIVWKDNKIINGPMKIGIQTDTGIYYIGSIPATHYIINGDTVLANDPCVPDSIRK